ncbi:MAG: dihydrodipicolinate reductase [Parcubacteria group bacterium Athens1014_10]|nr:MAG: dihydrodipicolinate reductase [Parcubacteria group bacterium Athens1014_10]TSD04506.1 MAG: dihydrodipicolinate reductase [Parcubacteria group bacterium Athens0714_12]
MIKVAVCGAGGKMGSRVVNLILNDQKMRLVCGVEKRPPDWKSKTIFVIDLKDVINSVDVVIDFSDPDSCLRHLEIAVENKKRMVIGATGFNDSQKDLIRDFSSEIACVLAPNMSIGANVLFVLVEQMAKIFFDYDTDIVEIHNNQKKDAPSGTAEKIAQIIYNINPKQKIDIHSLRMGDIVSEHTVIFAGKGERIELIHKVNNRDVFAQGAIRAAKWVVNKPAGLYEMSDVLGIARYMR